MRKKVLLSIALYIFSSTTISQKTPEIRNYLIKLELTTIVITIKPNTYLGEPLIFTSLFRNADVSDLGKLDFTKSVESTVFDYMGYSNKTIYIQKTVTSSIIDSNNKKINLLVSTNEAGEGIITLTTSGFINRPFKVKLKSEDLLSTEMMSDLTEIK